MRSLDIARDCCRRFHPGLLTELEHMTLSEREAQDSPVVELYRGHGGPGLLVPADYGGAAAGPLEAVRVQRALGALSPSLAVMTVMHHFTVAMLFSLTATAERLTPAQVKILSTVAGDGLLFASGWAEGKSNQNILTPTVIAERTTTGYTVNGAKKPCSLSRSMDILTASAAITDEDGHTGLALLLIPADTPGISVVPFWNTHVLTASESHQVRLENVQVPHDLVIRSTPQHQTRLDDLQTAGFTWFEMLTTAAYTGAASALVEQVITRQRGIAAERARLTTRLEAAINLLEGTARAIGDGLTGDEAVTAVLVARYASQDLLTTVVNQAVEMLGGIAFINSPDITYLASTIHALAFHPPSRASVATELTDYFAGKPLRLS